MDTTKNNRPNYFQEYIDKQVAYILAHHPEMDKKTITKWVADKVKTKCNTEFKKYTDAKQAGSDLEAMVANHELDWPVITDIRHVAKNKPKVHSYGNITLFRDDDLFALTKQYSDKIVSPFGTYYETVDNCVSFLKGIIDQKGADRKKYKKEMFKAKKNNQPALVTYYNGQQSTTKIVMNSMAGGAGADSNFLSSPANFNSITSIARYFIMNSYAHAERFLCGNFYFTTDDQVCDFILNCRLHGPDSGELEKTCKEHELDIPSAEQVYEFLTSCLHRYMFETEHPDIAKLVNSLSAGERCFVYYMSNLKNLVITNELKFRLLFESIFTECGVDHSYDVEPSAVFEVDEDMAVVLTTVYKDIIPKNKHGNSISLADCVETEPELAKRLARIGKHMEKQIATVQPVFDIFMNHNVAIANVGAHNNMFRDSIILSDTDSIIFTTKEWAKWWRGELVLDQDAYNINALVVYFLTKANKNILYRVSVAIGAQGNDRFTMKMKNEFMMPILILTSLKKHYLSTMLIQEGIVFGKPIVDIKGVNLRGSNFCEQTLTYTNWMASSIMSEIENTSKVSIVDKIQDVLRFESMVYQSLLTKSTEFLPVNPVRPEEEYKNSDISIYFNYLFWEEVFGDTYGHIAPPTKCYILPLKGLGSKEYLEKLRTQYPDILEKIQKFMNKYPGKDITRIPINPLTDKIPAELEDVVDYKSVVYMNTKPMYLILRSFGINLGNNPKKQKVLFSDVYGWLPEEEAMKARAIANK